VADRFGIEFCGLEGEDSAIVTTIDLRDLACFDGHPLLDEWNLTYAPFVVEVRPPAEDRQEGVCRFCGCTEDHACITADGQPCHWRAPAICSACADVILAPEEDDLDVVLESVEKRADRDGARDALEKILGFDTDHYPVERPWWTDRVGKAIDRLRPDEGDDGETTDKPDKLAPKPDKLALKPDKLDTNAERSGAPRADLVMVPIDQIDAGHNVRQVIDEAPLLQLTASIEQLGMIEPVVVRKLSKAEAAGGKRFRMVAGHRRLLAAERAGEEFVEAKIYSGVDDRWESRARLAENVQRMDLGHMDLARVFGDAVEAGLTVGQVAEEAHVSDDMVRRHLALLRLAEPIGELVASGRLPVHQAALIARVGDPDRQMNLAESCCHMTWDGEKTGWKKRPPYGHKEGDPEDYVMPMRELRQAVSTALCGLAACGWLKVEAAAAAWAAKTGEAIERFEGETAICELGGIAGRRPCAGCPDNSATYADQPGLFAGVHPQGSDKRGYCTNRPCYETKTAAWEKVKTERKKKEAKKTKAKITQAKKAGLDVCELCGKVADADQTFEPCEAAGGVKVCPKCAEKAAKRQASARRAESGYQAKQRKREQLEASFPATAAQRAALALWERGQRAAAAIRGQILKAANTEDLREAAWASCCGLATAGGADGVSEIVIDTGELAPIALRGDGDGIGQDAEGLVRLWDVASMQDASYGGETRWEMLYKPGVQHWSANVVNVPMEPEAAALCELFEEIIRWWGLGPEVPPKPTAAETTGGETEGSDGETTTPAAGSFVRSLETIPATILRVESADPGPIEGRGADGRVFEVTTRVEPADEAEISAWRNERESRVLNAIRQGRKKEAMAMIDLELDDEGDWLTPAELLFMLRTAQSGGLTGDWRRAAVARRIKALEGELGGEEATA